MACLKLDVLNEDLSIINGAHKEIAILTRIVSIYTKFPSNYYLYFFTVLLNILSITIKLH